MTIREATAADVPAIVDLLRLSLGDVSTTKSAAYWAWKHVHNPFGPSRVLLAEADGILVGVRAFMQWRWTDGRREYTALRAVDTATHPGYRGQGIFKKLTLALIDLRTRAGDDFIFNTPNEQSKPGYLKMGWRELGRLPVSLRIHRPLTLLRNKLSKHASPVDLPPPPAPFDWAIGSTIGSTIGAGPQVEAWRTAPRGDYLTWRYRDCPVVDYVATGEAGKYLIVAHPKQGALGLELRIVSTRIDPAHAAAARRGLAALVDRYRPVYSSVAPGGGLDTGVSITRPFGPVLTYRTLNYDRPPGLSDWQYELGDMELF